jgi:hypothetical protein
MVLGIVASEAFNQDLHGLVHLHTIHSHHPEHIPTQLIYSRFSTMYVECISIAIYPLFHTRVFQERMHLSPDALGRFHDYRFNGTYIVILGAMYIDVTAASKRLDLLTCEYAVAGLD